MNTDNLKILLDKTSYCVTKEEAEDLLWDMVLILVDNHPKVDPNKLFEMAKNFVAMHIRGHSSVFHKKLADLFECPLIEPTVSSPYNSSGTKYITDTKPDGTVSWKKRMKRFRKI